MMPFAFILSTFLVLANVHMHESVVIFFEYGPQIYYPFEFPPETLVSAVKTAISAQVRIRPENQQITDFYFNAAQRADGFGGFMDNKKLSDYGITKQTKGKILQVLKRVDINGDIPITRDQLSVVYSDMRVIRIALNGDQTIGALKTYLSNKVDIPVASQTLQDWYLNPLVDADGEMNDTKTLASYGITTGSVGRIVSISIFKPKTEYVDQKGPLVLIYGSCFFQAGFPFKPTETVKSFRNMLQKITGIAPADQLIVDLNSNEAQNKDDGIWKDNKVLADYGMKDGKDAALAVLKKAPKSDQPW